MKAKCQFSIRRESSYKALPYSKEAGCEGLGAQNPSFVQSLLKLPYTYGNFPWQYTAPHLLS